MVMVVLFLVLMSVDLVSLRRRDLSRACPRPHALVTLSAILPIRSAMATVTTSDISVTLLLTRTERLVGFHGDISAPLASITAVRASDDLWNEVRGLRAPGIGIPGVLVVCTLRGGFGRDFAVVHRMGSGVILEFDGEPFRRWVVSVKDPQGVAAEILTASGPGVTDGA